MHLQRVCDAAAGCEEPDQGASIGTRLVHNCAAEESCCMVTGAAIMCAKCMRRHSAFMIDGDRRVTYIAASLCCYQHDHQLSLAVCMGMPPKCVFVPFALRKGCLHCSQDYSLLDACVASLSRSSLNLSAALRMIAVTSS